MAENEHNGMQTFDQALFKLFKAGQISEDTALAEADNPADLGLMIRQDKAAGGEGGFEQMDTSKLSL